MQAASRPLRASCSGPSCPGLSAFLAPLFSPSLTAPVIQVSARPYVAAASAPPRWDSVTLIVLAALGLTFAALVTWGALQRGIRLRREARDDYERTLFLAAAGEEFARSLDPETLLDSVCRKATQVLGDGSAIYFLHDDAPVMEVACALERSPRPGSDITALFRERPLNRGEGIAGHVADTGLPLLAEDYPSSPYAEPLRAETLGVRSALAVPMTVGDRVLGVLVVYRYQDEARLTAADLRLASLLADRAAIGLDHARVYRRLENLVEERTRELREAHQQLLETERSRAIADLAAMVAHEVRNPLHILRTTTYALRQRLQGQDVRVDRNLETLDRTVDAAARIIQDLMEFGNNPEPDFITVDLREVAQEVAPSVPFPDEVELRVEMVPEPVPVRCDRQQVARAIRSLLLNGVQAHDDRGTVTLRVFQDGNSGVVEVQDTGRGVPNADRSKLFKPLFSTKVKGAGLGLALCRRILDVNGGWLGFESVPGSGSTFRAGLPLLNREEAPHAPERAPAQREGLGPP